VKLFIDLRLGSKLRTSVSMPLLLCTPLMAYCLNRHEEDFIVSGPHVGAIVLDLTVM
jgi:hypothetical protein